MFGPKNYDKTYRAGATLRENFKFFPKKWSSSFLVGQKSEVGVDFENFQTLLGLWAKMEDTSGSSLPGTDLHQC